jgi:hypothetical protein
MAATGQLGMAAAGQIQLTVVNIPNAARASHPCADAGQVLSSQAAKCTQNG